MKAFIFASLLLTVSAQASTFNCFSHEEIGPVYTMTIGKAKQTADMNGRPYSYRQVIIKERGQVIVRAEGVGSASASKIDLTLLQEGDIAIGSMNMKKYMPGRLTGSVNVVTGAMVASDMSCVVKK